jgi:Ca2+-binding RTX toxin-like protein
MPISSFVVKDLVVFKPLDFTNFAELIHDWRVGTDGQDWMTSTGADDWLFGGKGGDVLEASNQGSHLSGGAGNDRLVAGKGSDVLNGGADFDTADYKYADQGIQVDLATGEVSGGARGDTLISIENIVGSNQSDWIFGSKDNNTIWGGGSGDLIAGGDGDDTLLGDAGDDVLLGGSGHNTLYGGTGADRFIFDKSMFHGYNVIHDLESVDRIDLTQIERSFTQHGSRAFHHLDVHAGVDPFTGIAGIDIDVHEVYANKRADVVVGTIHIDNIPGYQLDFVKQTITF